VDADSATDRVLDLVVRKGEETSQSVIDDIDSLATVYPTLSFTLQSSDL
jgi:hypothetical protein